MKILLTQSYLIERDPPEKKIMRPYPPLGIMYLASYLLENGFDVQLVDNTFEPDLTTITRAIKEYSPDLVGISAVEITRGTAMQICSIAKESGCVVIVGGPDPVNYREEYFESGADYICAGEGENTLLELAQIIRDQNFDKIKSVHGLYLRDNGVETFTGDRELIENLDSLPITSWSLVPIDSYLDAWKQAHGESSMAVMSSRGCPRSCRWCSRSVFGRTLRRRSPKNFLTEIITVNSEYHPDYIWIADDSFISSPEWLGEFHLLIDDSKLKFSYECLGRVDEITDHTAEILKSTGCRFIWFGAESGSQRVLDAMKKGFEISSIERAHDLMSKHGIPVGFFIMLGYPPENMDDVLATVSMIQKLKPDKVGVSVAYPIAGTDFYDDVMSGNSGSWKQSGENRPVFRTRYSPNFYFYARRLILKEAQVARDGASELDKAKIAVYRSGMKLASLFDKQE